MEDPRNFVEWVCDPARTNDELFTVELLIEHRRHALDWAFPEFREDFDAQMERKRARGADPGYRPGLHEGEIEQLAVQSAQVAGFYGGNAPDRLLRDLKALAFFPALTNLSVNGDFRDLSPLASLRGLKMLTISEHMELAGSHRLQLSECGDMPELEYFYLSLHQAWPDVRAVAKWPKLAEFRFTGNVLVWEEVPVLPLPRLVHLKAGAYSGTPLRDLRKLPEMAAARQLVVERTESLEGIERYGKVLNLDLGGPFLDLAPLTAMTNLTALTLTGEIFRDLSPLARMPKLREVRLVRERSIDLTPLTDCPQLRRVEMERCAMMRTEVYALNAGLLPEALDFLADEARTLPPLKFFVTSKENETGKKFFADRQIARNKAREQFYDGDAALASAEVRAMGDILHRRLNELLGRGWGIANGKYLGPGNLHLKRFEDTMRVREVIDVLREESARSRFPWHFLLSVEPHGDMSEDLEQMKEREEEEAKTEGDWLARYYEPDEVLRGNEEERREREKRYEFLTREYLLQLRGEDGVDPSLLSLPKDEDDPKNPEPENDPVSPSATDDDDAGGVAIAPPPPPPPETKSLGEELAYYLDVYEDCIVANQHWAKKAAYNLGLTPVEWNAELAS
jgi:hypothetical protein